MKEQANNRKKSYLCLGILAHVDAGKTTLSEQILYHCRVIEKAGRVDHQNTFLDNYSLERERGITIFSKQALFSLQDFEVTLLDTPGHMDFGTEMERTLQVLDYAVLVISGSEGVQSHTLTLWKLLQQYQVPVFVFVNKMDRAKAGKELLLQEMQRRLSTDLVDFEDFQKKDSFWEEIAVREEALLEAYLEGRKPAEEEIRKMIAERRIFPCFFGSALKDWGVESFLEQLALWMQKKEYPQEFAARVFKIGRDEREQRLTYLKVTGGCLKVKQLLEGTIPGKEARWSEKADQIRLYSGEQYTTKELAKAGQICAVTGFSQTYAGQALGAEKEDTIRVLEPVLTYRMKLPETVSVYQAYEKLQVLAQEDPGLSMEWKEELGEIYVKVMGEIQLEVLKQLIRERFLLEVEFDSGHIVYKESIQDTVEGVGHFEPLRHYAEVHLKLEPLAPGSGLQFESICSEDVLDKNWQRLVLTHLAEKQHIGVLTGAPLTDVKITLLTGKAHAKHTEGGDFRQATYRAVRQGLRKANCILLEPIYEYTLEIPKETVGRAMSDLQKMYGTAVLAESTDVEIACLTGICPVITMQEYVREVAAYTKGRGRLECRLKGYAPCHNAEEIVEHTGYDPDRDVENPCGSVFCSHGAGVIVDWREVQEYMHLDMVLQEDVETEHKTIPEVRQRQVSQGIGTEEIDAILQRTYGANKKTDSSSGKPGWMHSGRKREEAVTRVYKGTPKRETYLLADGYNIIFAWKELKELAEVDLNGARDRLKDILCDYQAMKGCQVMVVFDAYRLQGHPVEAAQYHNIQVIFTKEAETADQYIEKFAVRHGKEYSITVATSDGLEQVIIRGQGCHLLSARDLQEEIARCKSNFQQQHMQPKKEKNTLGQYLPEEWKG